MINKEKLTEMVQRCQAAGIEKPYGIVKVNKITLFKIKTDTLNYLEDELGYIVLVNENLKDNEFWLLSKGGHRLNGFIK